MSITKAEPSSPKAHWIWDTSDRFSRNYYLRAKRTFSLSDEQATIALTSGRSQLLITADAYYQVWINGAIIGHGPAKSPQGQRYLDSYDISDRLTAGQNVLEVLVLSHGMGTMSYCPGEAGLLFQLELPGLIISSDEKTLVQRDPQRTKPTVRRWVLPYIEDVDAQQKSDEWTPAQIVTKETTQLPRPVALPQRQPLTAKRIISIDAVKLPEFSVSFRVKPYLVAADQVARWNTYVSPAYIVFDLISPRDQEITLVPAAGQVNWYFNGRLVVEGKAWGLWDPATAKATIKLKKGANRFIGAHHNSHFEEIHFAAFAPHALKVKNPFGAGGFQVIPADKESVANSAKLPRQYDSWIQQGNFPKMDPSDTMYGANGQDLAVNARLSETVTPNIEGLYKDGVWRFPGNAKGHATRLIIDLGAVNNGWLSFKAFGQAGGKLIFSFFEALEFGPPIRINWPEAVNNAVTYRLRDGWQEFESFHPYGVRYIAVYYDGPKAAALKELQVLTPNCGSLPRGAFLSDNVALNGIYTICEQTVISATDDSLTDCPTYEAVNWNFDNRLGAMTDLLTARNIDVLRNTIEQYAHDPYYPGLVRSHYPSTWENRIPVFSFHWILLCEDFHRHTGDQQFLSNVFGQVARGIEEGLQMIDSSGLLLWPAAENPWHIIDWNMHRDDDGHPVVSAEQGVFIGTLAAGEYLAEATGKAEFKALAKEWKEARIKLGKAVHKALWLPERDAYADSLHADGSLSKVTSMASNAILSIYGVGSSAWQKRLAKRIHEKDESMLAATSPMGMFYVLEALDCCDDVEAIFQIILEKWTPMLQAGDGTTWEHFPEFANLSWPTRSRCHPFATYITKYFVKYLLGIELSGEKMSTVTFRPRPPQFLNECHGAIPTAQGAIRTGWKRSGKRITSNIELPKGTVLKKS